jgi:hypothetical protein
LYDEWRRGWVRGVSLGFDSRADVAGDVATVTKVVSVDHLLVITQGQSAFRNAHTFEEI